VPVPPSLQNVKWDPRLLLPWHLLDKLKLETFPLEDFSIKILLINTILAVCAKTSSLESAHVFSFFMGQGF
jgi:hypothetical protein